MPGYPQAHEQGFSGFPPTYPQAQSPRTSTYPQPVHNPAVQPVDKPRRRRLPIYITALVVGLLLLGFAGWRVWDNQPKFAPPPPTVAEALPGPVLAGLGSSSIPSAAVLRAQLEPLVTQSDLGRDVSASVVDLRTGQVLYERNPTNMAVPASNTKLATAAAVLATRGPAYRITTRVVAGSKPGEVVLIGSGDATLSIDAEAYYAGAGRLDFLAQQVKAALGGTNPSKVIIDTSLYSGPTFGPSWESNADEDGYTSRITALMVNGARVNPKDKESPFDRFPDPELAAGEAFAKLLGLPASAVAKGQAPTAAPASASPGTTPGAQLGAVESAPMLRQLEQMLGESDNTLAEALARQVAVVKGQPASFEGAATAVEQVLTELGVPSGQFDIADGSGYSTRNQLSPAALTALITKAASDSFPALADMFNVLPIAGWSGSMDYRFAKPDAAAGLGVVRAKSGTLKGVNSISGVVQTADGGLIAFAVLAENVPVWQFPAQDALDRIVAKIAACGCS